MENSGDGEGAFYRRRRSIRLPHYDYAQRGVYFITLCVQHRRSLFGDVIDGSMVLKNLGEIVATEWRRTSEIRPNIVVDEFVVMPNHLHGLIVMEPQEIPFTSTNGRCYRARIQGFNDKIDQRVTGNTRSNALAAQLLRTYRSR